MLITVHLQAKILSPVEACAKSDEPHYWNATHTTEHHRPLKVAETSGFCSEQRQQQEASQDRPVGFLMPVSLSCISSASPVINPKLLPVTCLLLWSLKVVSRISYRITFSGIAMILSSLCAVPISLPDSALAKAFLSSPQHAQFCAHGRLYGSHWNELFTGKQARA